MTVAADLPVHLDEAMALVVMCGVAALGRRVRDQREAELVVAEESSLAAVQAREGFLARVSHELRTPLAGSLGTARLLLDELPEGPTRERVQTITRCSERLEELLDDVIDHAALREGKLRIRETRYLAHQLVEGSLALFEPMANEKGLVVRSEGRTPQVLGDSLRVRQVLDNLVSNAIKYTDAGEIVVRVTYKMSAWTSGSKTPAWESRTPRPCSSRSPRALRRPQGRAWGCRSAGADGRRRSPGVQDGPGHHGHRVVSGAPGACGQEPSACACGRGQRDQRRGDTGRARERARVNRP
ncbi:MAG: hypothetical protein GY913_02035 [Proteobacteria bacterium]|nr:hypothetical protein [Pseudomonadota bacterium]MCP4915678.1 hypothetical protein [Pseudomonadota bacterium]